MDYLIELPTAHCNPAELLQGRAARAGAAEARLALQPQHGLQPAMMGNHARLRFTYILRCACIYLQVLGLVEPRRLGRLRHLGEVVKAHRLFAALPLAADGGGERHPMFHTILRSARVHGPIIHLPPLQRERALQKLLRQGEVLSLEVEHTELMTMHN